MVTFPSPGKPGSAHHRRHTALSASREHRCTGVCFSTARPSPQPGESTRNGHWCSGSLRRSPGVARANTGVPGDLELRHHALLHTCPSSTASPEQGSCPRSEGHSWWGQEEGTALPRTPAQAAATHLRSCRTHRLKRKRALILSRNTHNSLKSPNDTEAARAAWSPQCQKTAATRHTRHGGRRPRRADGSRPWGDKGPGGSGNSGRLLCCSEGGRRVLSGPGLGAAAPQDTRETCLAEECGAGGAAAGTPPSLRTAPGLRVGPSGGTGGRWERREWASALPPSHSPALLPPGILKGIDMERVAGSSSWNVLDPGTQNRSSWSCVWRSHKEGTPGPPGGLRGR